MLFGILEDEEPQAELLKAWLTEAGYPVVAATSCNEFMELVERERPVALILDWVLPDGEGIDVLTNLRRDQGFDGPILFTTGRDSEQDIVSGLTAGADDYLVKPLRKAEFNARLNSVLRRVSIDRADTIELGPIRLDTGERQATVNGLVVDLSPTEFRLASCLCGNVGVLLSREYLLTTVWNVPATLETRKVDLYMSRIRRKLGIGPVIGYCLQTVYGHGYRLEKI